MLIAHGDKVRMGTRVGAVTYVAGGFADVDFARGDWSVVPVSALKLLKRPRKPGRTD